MQLPIDATSHPLTLRLLQQALPAPEDARRAGLLAALAALPRPQFDALEAEVGFVVAASGRSLEQCLQDLFDFNALTPETENDAWYDQPAAFTSMQLDALLPGFSQRRLQVSLDQVLAHADGAAQVLEVGCGSGRFSGMLADRTPASLITLVDRSAAAIAFAAAYHRVRGTGHRVDCRLGDLASIPAAAASFDAVVAAEVLEHAPDPEASAVELMRVLKPGGLLVISLPIDLDIAMHPTVFRSEGEIVQFFEGLGLSAVDTLVVRPDPGVDAIVSVFPGFEGCVNSVFRKPAVPGADPAKAATATAQQAR